MQRLFARILLSSKHLAANFLNDVRLASAISIRPRKFKALGILILNTCGKIRLTVISRNIYGLSRYVSGKQADGKVNEVVSCVSERRN